MKPLNIEFNNSQEKDDRAMTYTPGPWFADKKEYRLGDLHVRAGNGWLIAEVPHQFLKQTQRANAQLIAAAPQLLDACQLALVELDRIGSDIGFEPERYQERINALDALSRAIKAAKESQS